MPADRALLRMGAVSIVLGLLLAFGAGYFLGGSPPDDLRVVLPQVAANDFWVVVHLAQFVGDVLVLMATSLVALLWYLLLAFCLWRNAGDSGRRVRPQP